MKSMESFSSDNILVISGVVGLLLAVGKFLHYVFATGREVGEMRAEMRSQTHAIEMSIAAQAETTKRVDDIYKLLHSSH